MASSSTETMMNVAGAAGTDNNTGPRASTEAAPVARALTLIELFESTVSKYEDEVALCFQEEQGAAGGAAGGGGSEGGGGAPEVTAPAYTVPSDDPNEPPPQQQATVSRPPAQQQSQSVKWTTVTWRQYHTQCRAVASSLLALGVPAGGRVNICGDTAVEYFYSNIGAIFAACVPVCIQNADAASSCCVQIAQETDCQVLFLQGAAQCDRYCGGRSNDITSSSSALASSTTAKGKGGASKSKSKAKATGGGASTSSSGTTTGTQQQQRASGGSDRTSLQLTPLAELLPNLKAIVLWDVVEVEDSVAAGNGATTSYTTLSKLKRGSIPVYSWAEFLKVGATPAATATASSSSAAAATPDGAIASGSAAADFARRTDETLQQRRQAATTSSASAAACIVYRLPCFTGTSCVLEQPLGVVLSHDNLTFTATSAVTALGANEFNHCSRIVSYMSLSNAVTQMLDLYWPMAAGCTVYVLPHRRSHMLLQCLLEARPTLFYGTTRTWKVLEHIARALEQEKGAESWWQKNVTNPMARDLGLRASLLEQFEERHTNDDCDCNCTFHTPLDAAAATAPAGPPPRPFGYSIACKSLLHDLQRQLGLECCRYCFSAADAVESSTWTYFASLSFPILKLYGSPETSGVHALSTIACWSRGTVGRALPGTFSAISPYSGELRVQGRHVFLGYVSQDAAERGLGSKLVLDRYKYVAAFDQDSYFKTGELGELDERSRSRSSSADSLVPAGLLTLRGKLSDVIITATGDRIDSRLIERAIMAELQGIVSHCVVVGDGREYITVLLSFNVVHEICVSGVAVARDAAWTSNRGQPTDRLTLEVRRTGTRIGSTAQLYSEARVDPLWIRHVNDAVSRANMSLTQQIAPVQMMNGFGGMNGGTGGGGSSSSAVPHGAEVRRWLFFPHELSHSAGELTSALQVRRAVVLERYQGLISEAYAQPTYTHILV